MLVSIIASIGCSSYNQLLNEHSLSDTGTSEETNLSTTSVGGQQVDDLDTSDEDLSGGGLLDELWGVGVDRSELVGLDGTTLVNGVTSDVHDTAEGGRADGNGDGSTAVSALCSIVSNGLGEGRIGGATYWHHGRDLRYLIPSISIAHLQGCAHIVSTYRPWQYT